VNNENKKLAIMQTSKIEGIQRKDVLE